MEKSLSGEYWGRPNARPEDNENPDAVTGNQPFTPPAAPDSSATTETWSAPAYGSAPKAEQAAAPAGQDAAGVTGYEPSAPATSGFDGPTYSSPTYSTPTYGAPAYGTEAPAQRPEATTPGYGAPTDGANASAQQPEATTPSYQPANVPPPLPTPQPPAVDPAPTWSAPNLNLDAPGTENTYGATPQATSFPDSTSGYNQAPSNGYGYSSPAQPQGDSPQPYAQPSTNQGFAGGYAQPSQGYPQDYANQGYATQDYASQGYATTTPPASPYASAPTGGYGYAAPGQGVLSGPVAPNGQPYASWGKRVLSYLVDVIAPGIVIEVVVGIATASGSDALTGVTSTIMSIASIAWFLYNTVYLGGTTGQSWGRKIAGTRLLSGATGRPLGMGMAFVRQLAHFVDALICYIGYLFPLWDAKRQTLADKIVNSVVVDESTN